MTSSTQTTPATSSLSTLSEPASVGVGRFLKTWWEAYRARRAQRTAVLMLHSLDDRSLHDIGLDRSEIESVVYGKLGERQLRYERSSR